MRDKPRAQVPIIRRFDREQLLATGKQARAAERKKIYAATLYRLGMSKKGYRMQPHTIAHRLP